MEGNIQYSTIKDNGVAIFTTFYQIDPAYSLCNVVEDQLKMFTMHGYKIKVLVDEGLDESKLRGVWKHPNVTICKFLTVDRSNEGILPSDFHEQANKLYEQIKEILKDVKTVIAHDVILQPAHIIHNLACRRLAQERLDLSWIHWAHSSTAPQVKCSDPTVSNVIGQKFPNSIAAYPNDWDRARVARNWGYEMNEVKTVHHPSDFVELMFGKEIDLEEYPSLSEEDKQKLDKDFNYSLRLSKDLVEEFDLLSADVISAYPCRLDRGKQPEFLIKTMAKMKDLGRDVRCILFDFHSTGDDKVVFKEELQRIGMEWGLTPKELIFISKWREETSLSVPREVVMNIKKISDFHMHPSTSETYSLVVQESMAWKNFCVLNHHTPYMRDIYGSKNVLHVEFGSAVNILTGEDGSTNVSIYDEPQHFENLANKILYFIEEANPVIAQWRMIRQTKNLKYIFRRQLEPLLYGIDIK